MTHHKETFVQSLDKSIRENPVQAGLIGLGVLWMFAGRLPLPSLQNAVSAGSQQAGALRQAAAASAGGVSAAIGTAADAVSGGTKAVADGATSIVSQGFETTMSLGGDATQQLAAVFRSQPLLLGVAGLAIGAGIGATLSTTDAEHELFGPSADALRVGVADVMETQKDRLSTSLTAIADEATTQGLTKTNVSKTILGLKDTVKQVASKALPSGNDRPTNAPAPIRKYPGA